MSGDILAANQAMLAFVAGLGFAVDESPGEPGVRHVTLGLKSA